MISNQWCFRTSRKTQSRDRGKGVGVGRGLRGVLTSCCANIPASLSSLEMRPDSYMTAYDVLLLLVGRTVDLCPVSRHILASLSQAKRLRDRSAYCMKGKGLRSFTPRSSSSSISASSRWLDSSRDTKWLDYERDFYAVIVRERERERTWVERYSN